MKRVFLFFWIAVISTGVFANQTITENSNPRELAEKFYFSQHYADAFKEYERLAKTGDAQSLYNLAFMTRHGQGTKKDEKKALRYYQQAAKKHVAQAHMALAEAYLFNELGLKYDPVQVKKHLQQASNLGFKDAHIELANLYFSEGSQKADQQALLILKPLLEQNDLAALHLKAVYDLKQGLQQSNESRLMEGLKTLESLTKQGYIPSMMAVGTMMMYGEVVPQNLDMAKTLFTILVQNNIPTAQERLTEVERMLQQSKKN